LGKDEYGSTISLPIWIEFMQSALASQPEILREPPAGIISVLINKKTGKRTQPGDPDSMFEYIQENKADSIESQDSPTTTTQEIQSIF
jgi:penicillin-binding protein 1A